MFPHDNAPNTNAAGGHAQLLFLPRVNPIPYSNTRPRLLAAHQSTCSRRRPQYIVTMVLSRTGRGHSSLGNLKAEHLLGFLFAAALLYARRATGHFLRSPAWPCLSNIEIGAVYYFQKILGVPFTRNMCPRSRGLIRHYISQTLIAAVIGAHFRL